MEKRRLIKLLEYLETDTAECRIGLNPPCLIVIDGEVCHMIKLDGDWEYDLKGDC